MPTMIGVPGRRPDGPRLSMNVRPAPIVAPISAAVSRSYSVSRPLTSRSWPDTRGCWERRRGWFGAAVVAIVFLQNFDFVGRIGRIELVRRKVHPTATAKCRGPGLDAAHRRGGRHKQLLGLRLHHRKQGVELVNALFGHRDRLAYLIVRPRHRGRNLVDVRANGGGHGVYVLGDRARALEDRSEVGV